MSTILDTTPLGTQAAAIDAVRTAKHPRLALPTIASNFDMPLDQLQVILRSAGYPDPDCMKTHAQQLRARAALAVSDLDGDPAALGEETGYARVPVDQVRPDPNNVREHVHNPSTDSTSGYTVDDIDQLADSIREVGLLQPIVVRRTEIGELVVVAGHRRLAAIKRLRWTDVDVIIRSPMKPDHVIAAMLIENGQRRDLNPIEEARGIRRLKATQDLTDAAVARKIGRTQSYVSGRLALLLLSAEEQELVRSGEMGRTAAANLGRLKSGKTRSSSKGHVTVQYFGPTHDLATRAKARCDRLRHRGKVAGGMACGSCWESVIRAAEREALQDANARADDCVTCGHPIDHTAEASR